MTEHDRAVVDLCRNVINEVADGAGHWRDWHRGHGCNLDPEAP